MSTLKKATCPSCQAVLSFTPSKNASFALSCPTCGNLFEVNAEDLESPVPAVEQKPMIVAQAVQAQPLEQAIPVSPITPSEPDPEDDPFHEIPKPILPGARPSYHATEKPKRGPVGPRKPVAKKHQKSNNLLLLGTLPVLLVFAVAGTLGYYLLNPPPAGAERIVVDSQAAVIEFLDVTENIESAKDRKWAAGRIESLNKQLEETVFEAITLDDERDSKLVKATDRLEEYSVQWREVEQRSAEFKLGHPSHELLVMAVSNTTAHLEAIRAITKSVLQKDPKPEDMTAKIVNRGIQVEERFVRRLGAIKSTSDVAASIDALQEIIDEYNALAEEQSSYGEKIGAIPNEMVAIESDLGAVKDYFVSRTERVLRPEPDFKLTVRDFDHVEERFDQSLFKFPIPVLSSTSRQRVAGLEPQLEGVDSVASARAASRKSGGVASRPSESLVARNDDNQNSTPYGYENDGNGQEPMTRQPDPFLATPEDEFNGREPFADRRPNTGGFDSRPPTGMENDIVEPGPRGIDRNTGRESNVPSIDSFAGRDSADRSYNSAPVNMKAAPMSGPNSLTVRIFDAQNVNVIDVRRRLTRMLSSPTSLSDDAGDHVILSFRFSGDVFECAKYINFGEIELSDNQSRTIFVRGR
ncbi:MAG: hypothetical protein AAGG44_10195 [Planctomycetota bacterium]